jgi:hypothetical protein
MSSTVTEFTECASMRRKGLRSEDIGHFEGILRERQIHFAEFANQHELQQTLVKLRFVKKIL